MRLGVAILAFVVWGSTGSATEYPHLSGAFHVHPPAEIQPALELAANHPTDKRVVVHAGVYRPKAHAQALIWLNHRHEGVVLEADGDVLLSAENAEIADRSSESFPAVVNHVVYFGDGISQRTVLRGFRISGANNYVTDRGGPEAIEPRFAELRNTEGFYGKLFFFTDGGAIKIFGRSYPMIERIVISNNFARPCAGGVSIEHRGFREGSVLLTNCVFRANRAAATGSAIDLLPGSTAEIVNCLFVANMSNTEEAFVRVKGNIDWPEIPKLVTSALRYQAQHGSGALTVFPNSSVTVDRCTFTDNLNGVDDMGGKSSYSNSIFWQNTRPGGRRTGQRYELNLAPGTIVSNCFVKGEINDVAKIIRSEINMLNCPEPLFDEKFQPRASGFARVGYRE